MVTIKCDSCNNNTVIPDHVVQDIENRVIAIERANFQRDKESDERDFASQLKSLESEIITKERVIDSLKRDIEEKNRNEENMSLELKRMQNETENKISSLKSEHEEIKDSHKQDSENAIKQVVVSTQTELDEKNRQIETLNMKLKNIENILYQAKLELSNILEKI